MRSTLDEAQKNIAQFMDDDAMIEVRVIDDGEHVATWTDDALHAILLFESYKGKVPTSYRYILTEV